MKILVTGAAGFLGGKLVSLLEERGHYVLCLDRRGTEWLLEKRERGYLHDITDDEGLEHMRIHVARELGEIDACVHLAAIAAPRQAAANPKLAWDTNVRGTQNVLSFCRALGARKLVFASSAHVYGISPKYMPTDERHPLSMLDTYTVTKVMGEQLCRLTYENYGLSYVALRLYNAYGPGQSADYFLGKKIGEAAAGRKVSLINASVTKDWVWAGDVARAMVAAVETAYVGPINIGTGVETSLREIAKRVATYFHVGWEEEDGSDSSPTRMLCDPSRAAQVLGWRSEVDFSKGLDQTIRAAAAELRPA